jgi:hypothetical protein
MKVMKSTSHGEILHIIGLDKFIEPFIEFTETHFRELYMHFFISGDENRYQVRKRENVIFESC